MTAFDSSGSHYTRNYKVDRRWNTCFLTLWWNWELHCVSCISVGIFDRVKIQLAIIILFALPTKRPRGKSIQWKCFGQCYLRLKILLLFKVEYFIVPAPWKKKVLSEAIDIGALQTLTQWKFILNLNQQKTFTNLWIRVLGFAFDFYATCLAKSL